MFGFIVECFLRTIFNQNNFFKQQTVVVYVVFFFVFVLLLYIFTLSLDSLILFIGWVVLINFYSIF